MARIRKDSTNWNGRKQVSELEGKYPEIPKQGKKKNTKLWCKGKEGRLHEYEKVKELWLCLSFVKSPHKNIYHWCLRCKTCNKKVWKWEKEFKEFGNEKIRGG